MATATDVRHLSDIDPEMDAVLKKAGPLPPLGGDVQQLRARLSEAKKALTASHQGGPSNTIEEDKTIKGRDGWAIPVRIYKPMVPSQSGSPLVIMLHGGGFVLGGLENEELNCRLFVEKYGAIVINVDYRLAPEHPFPAAPNDAWDVVQWAAANAAELGAHPDKGFIVGGTSAGGNLTDVVGHLARDEKLSPPLTGLLELIPALLPPSVVPSQYKNDYISHEQNKDAPILSKDTLEFFMTNYKPDPHSILYATFNNPRGHAGLPPVFLQVCGWDPLRDEALIYERVLREQGVKTNLKIYKGLPHGFWSYFPTMKASQRFVADTVEGLGWLLEQGGKLR